MIADTIIRVGEAIPTNIVLHVPPDGSLAFPSVAQKTTVYLTDGTFLLGGGGVFPVIGHVRTPDAYGPTGMEYFGIEVLPVEADVKLGVGYGENGTEKTGKFIGDSGSTYLRRR